MIRRLCRSIRHEWARHFKADTCFRCGVNWRACSCPVSRVGMVESTCSSCKQKTVKPGPRKAIRTPRERIAFEKAWDERVRAGRLQPSTSNTDTNEGR